MILCYNSDWNEKFKILSWLLFAMGIWFYALKRGCLTEKCLPCVLNPTVFMLLMREFLLWLYLTPVIDCHTQSNDDNDDGDGDETCSSNVCALVFFFFFLQHIPTKAGRNLSLAQS